MPEPAAAIDGGSVWPVFLPDVDQIQDMPRADVLAYSVASDLSGFLSHFTEPDSWISQRADDYAVELATCAILAANGRDAALRDCLATYRLCSKGIAAQARGQPCEVQRLAGFALSRLLFAVSEPSLGGLSNAVRMAVVTYGCNSKGANGAARCAARDAVGHAIEKARELCAEAR